MACPNTGTVGLTPRTDTQLPIPTQLFVQSVRAKAAKLIPHSHKHPIT